MNPELELTVELTVEQLAIKQRTVEELLSYDINDFTMTIEMENRFISFCVGELMKKFGFLFRIFKFSLDIEKQLFKKLWGEFFESLTTDNFKIINNAIFDFNTIRTFNVFIIETIYEMMDCVVGIIYGNFFQNMSKREEILLFYKNAIQFEITLISNLHKWLTKILPVGNFILCEFNQFMYSHDITIGNLWLENNYDHGWRCDSEFTLTKINNYDSHIIDYKNIDETQDLDNIPLYCNLYYPKNKKDSTTFDTSEECVNTSHKPKNTILYFSDIPEEAIKKFLTLPNDIVIIILGDFLGCLSNIDIYNMSIKSPFVFNTSGRFIHNIFINETNDFDFSIGLETLKEYYEHFSGVEIYYDMFDGLDKLYENYTKKEIDVKKMKTDMLNMLKITEFKQVDETILN
jgi:hypothetical protein